MIYTMRFIGKSLEKYAEQVETIVAQYVSREDMKLNLFANFVLGFTTSIAPFSTYLLIELN